MWRVCSTQTLRQKCPQNCLFYLHWYKCPPGWSKFPSVQWLSPARAETRHQWPGGCGHQTSHGASHHQMSCLDHYMWGLQWHGAVVQCYSGVWREGEWRGLTSREFCSCTLHQCYSRGLCGGTMFTNPQGTCSSVLRLSEHHLIPWASKSLPKEQHQVKMRICIKQLSSSSSVLVPLLGSDQLRASVLWSVACYDWCYDFCGMLWLIP